MKSVYIDVLFTVNIFIDFILILCTKKALCINTSFKRMLFASFFGGVQSLIALLPPLPFILNIPIDILCAAAIIFFAFGKAPPKKFIKRTAIFLSLSFSFCGIMLFLYNAFKPKGMEVYNDIVYFNISPVLLIILTLVCYYILRLVKILTKSGNSSDICKVEIKVNEKVFFFSAKADTGCNLTEPFSGNYVIVAERKLFDGFVPSETKTRVIPFESLGGNGIVKGFPPDEVKIDGRKIDNNIYIGICDNVLKGDVEAIIPYELLKLTE